MRTFRDYYEAGTGVLIILLAGLLVGMFFYHHPGVLLGLGILGVVVSVIAFVPYLLGRLVYWIFNLF